MITINDINLGDEAKITQNFLTTGKIMTDSKSYQVAIIVIETTPASSLGASGVLSITKLLRDQSDCTLDYTEYKKKNRVECSTHSNYFLADKTTVKNGCLSRVWLDPDKLKFEFKTLIQIA